MFTRTNFISEHEENMVKRFDRYMGMASVSPLTRKSYVSVVKTLAARGDVFKCNREWIEDNISLNPDLKPASKKNYILALRRLYTWLIECGVRRDNPANLVKIPE
jgi:site-specific recombinase XerD